MLLLKAFYFVLFFSFSSLPAYFALYISEHLGFSADTVGVIQAAAPLVSFVMSPLWATLVDRTRMHKLVLIMLPLLSVGLLNLLPLLKNASPAYVFVISIGNSIVMSPISSLLDTVVLSLLPDPELIGQQRLFGSLAYGIGAFLTGYSTDKVGISAMFYIYTVSIACFCILVLISPIRWCFVGHERQQQVTITAPLVVDVKSLKEIEHLQQQTHHSHQHLRQSTLSKIDHEAMVAFEAGLELTTPISITRRPLSIMDSAITLTESKPRAVSLSSLCTISVGLFLTTMMLMGIVSTTIGSFLWLWLTEYLHAPKSFLGLTSPFQIAMELPFFYWSKVVIHRIGIAKMIMAAHIAIILRVLAYTLLPQDQPSYIILAVETLHGLSFAWLFSAAVQIAREIAPLGREALVQAIMVGTYSNLGGFIGNIAGGIIYTRLGPIKMFYVLAGVASCSLMLFTLRTYLVHKQTNKARQQVQKISFISISSYKQDAIQHSTTHKPVTLSPV